MDTKQNHREAGPTDGPSGRRPEAGLGWWPGALAVVALVAVIAAAIWAVASDGRSSGGPEDRVGLITTSTATDAAKDKAQQTTYLLDPNTGDVRIVSTEPADAPHTLKPELSPDGERVAYERLGPNGLSQIYLLEPDGTERPLTDLRRGAFDPTWSPDGTTIAFSAAMGRGEDTDILVMDARGSHVRRLVGTAGDDVDPDWSPDGSRIAFQARYESGRGGIWLADARTGRISRLTPNSVHGAMDPAWSPDGRWIAYSRYAPHYTFRGRLYGAQLSITRSDGTGERAIKGPGKDRVNENPSWSPEGGLIVFESHNWNWDSDRVLLIDPRTGHVRPILTGAEADVPSGGRYVLGTGLSPSWGPDGILLSLPSGNPTPSPAPAPPSFQVVQGIEAPGIDATIRVHPGPGCGLDIDDPISPGVLKLELVNDSHLEGGFRVMRLKPTQNIGQLRADPRGFLFMGRRTEFLDPSSARLWSSAGRVASGSWAVICYRDRIPSPNAGTIVPIGVAGPIEIEA